MKKKSIKTVKNPFVTTGYIGPEYFCDRKKETDDLVRLLTNGNNVALISPRRIGKTDLLRHCFAQPVIAKNYYTFIIDIYSTKSLAEMVNKMGSVILETLKPQGRRVWGKFLDTLVSVKHSIGFDINGLPFWSLSVGDLKSPTTTLDEIFKYISLADKPVLVAIDEFQQITKYDETNTEASLRTYVQYCSNANFVFSGSRQHLMGTMFTSPARPFYQSVTIYGLKCIPFDKYASFCVSKFEERNKSIDTLVVERLYNQFEGVTYYLQRVMNEMFSNTPVGSKCTCEYIDEAIHNIIADSSPIYEDLLYQLPPKQSQVLMAIAREGKAENLTSGQFASKYGIVSPSSVKSAVPALIDKGLLTLDKGVCQVYDKFFQLWMLQQR